jgi:hypothetical protein
MMSISWISLPPDALRRIAAHESAAAPGGRRGERIAALVVAGLVSVLATVVVLVIL